MVAWTNRATWAIVPAREHIVRPVRCCVVWINLILTTLKSDLFRNIAMIRLLKEPQAAPGVVPPTEDGMSRSKIGMVAVSLMTVLAAGCQSERFSQLESRSPAPLTPAPSGTVQTSQLPPPSGPLSPTEFPEAPQQQNQQMAALDPSAAANAPDISAGSVAGVWTVNVAGQSCRVATPQTKFGQGYRAGPLRCPAPLDGVKSWNVEGGQLAFYDANGGVLARLSSSGTEQFNGQTSTGQPISLSR